MALRKKNQIPAYYTEEGNNMSETDAETEEIDSAPRGNLASALSERDRQKPERDRQKRVYSNARSMSAVIGLVAGIAGSVIGVIYVAPWYQTNVLKQAIAPSNVENRKIVVNEESAIISAVEKVNPAVVSIVITKDLPKLEQLGSPFGGFFFEAPSGETEKQQIGAGTGFVVSSDGMIVTNKHVVYDTAAEYTVVTKDNQKYQAKVLARDSFNDLAIVKIEAKDSPFIELGDSDKIKLGQRVIAIGNALGEFQNTVTTGVISGIGRSITASGGAQSEKLSELIQTDAAINPGNSGGPLVNLDGQVIGVNTAVSQSAQLIGFAIPINQVKKDIDDVKQFGKIRRPFLGVRYAIVTDDFAKANNLEKNYGAIIVKGDTRDELAVVPASPADQVGLSAGDIIMEFDGEKITADRPLADLIWKYNPGDKVILKIWSGGKEKTVLVTLGEAQ